MSETTYHAFLFLFLGLCLLGNALWGTYQNPQPTTPLETPQKCLVRDYEEEIKKGVQRCVFENCTVMQIDLRPRVVRTASYVIAKEFTKYNMELKSFVFVVPDQDFLKWEKACSSEAKVEFY